MTLLSKCSISISCALPFAGFSNSPNVAIIMFTERLETFNPFRPDCRFTSPEREAFWTRPHGRVSDQIGIIARADCQFRLGDPFVIRMSTQRRQVIVFEALFTQQLSIEIKIIAYEELYQGLQAVFVRKLRAIGFFPVIPVHSLRPSDRRRADSCA